MRERFSKKLSLNKIELALERASNNEIKVELQQTIGTMPSILPFMKQQQNVGNIQARTIVNCILANFAD